MWDNKIFLYVPSVNQKIMTLNVAAPVYTIIIALISHKKRNANITDIVS